MGLIGTTNIAMIRTLTFLFTEYGSHRYKELYWNCGAIGQQLYLEATLLHLSATGIGCFLDELLLSILYR